MKNTPKPPQIGVKGVIFPYCEISPEKSRSPGSEVCFAAEYFSSLLGVLRSCFIDHTRLLPSSPALAIKGPAN